MAKKALTDKEREKLIQKLSEQFQKQLDDDLKQALTRGVWNQITTAHFNPNYGVSPTDVEARGHFPYIRPEQDEQGTYYGYKVLLRTNNWCNCPECSRLRSPRYPADWRNGELEANREPEANTMFGIHFAKVPNHPCLRDPIYHRTSGFDRGDVRSILVKCALSGTVVETEQGFRAQHAQIVEVYENGNWYSYSDYKERSRPNPYRTPEEEWKFRGDWGRNFHTYFDAGS